MTETPENPDPAGALAELMNRAATQADSAAAQAPYGYTKDAETGQMRPKKSPGRPRTSPSLDELKAQQPPDGGEPAGEYGGQPADRAPEQVQKRRGQPKEAAPAAPAPSYKAGVITKGINRLYRKAGKIIRVMDEDIGEAIIQAARNTADDDEPDDSVGAAWEELAKANPRIRRFVMKVIAGGAWGQLVMAHAPIAMAIVMKPAILRFIPFSRLIESLAEPDEDTPEGEGGLPGGMTAADASQMAALAQQQIQRMGFSVSPEIASQMAAAAEGMMNGARAPVQERNQPRRTPSRARRKQAA